MIIKLPDDDPETIRAIIYWIYHDEICVLEEIYERDCNYTTTTEAAMKTTWGLLAKLYVCGDKYQMPRLEFDAVDAMIMYVKDTGDLSCPAIIPWLYENTLPEARIRGLLVLFVKYAYSGSEMTKSKQYLCAKFLYDLSFSLLGAHIGDEMLLFPENDHCLRFHNHDSTTKSFRPCTRLEELEYYDPQTDRSDD